jgi:4'-phosphopantetheinyl transferase EntD
MQLIIPDKPDHYHFTQFFTHEFCGEEVLTENERMLTQGFQEKRMKDFSTGRYCARKALSLLNIPPGDILMGPGREPLWPAGIVGSISHSQHLTGAIAGPAEKFRSLGLDIETIGGVKDDLWNVLFTQEEHNLLNAFPAELRIYYATLFFSMKECFYKLQFPLTKQFIEFTEVEVISEKNEFQIRVLKMLDKWKVLPELTTIHTVRDGNNVVCYAFV